MTSVLTSVPTPVLHDYQRAAVAFLRSHPFAALWLDMGLGKTAAVLSALTPDALPVLVSAPKRVASEVWPAEVPKWRPDLTIELADGSPQHRKQVLSSSRADITVVGRDVMHDAVPYADRWRTLILDESSGFKDPSTRRFKAARKLSESPLNTRLWEMTGTPAPNGLMDLWGQIFLLDHGERLGRNITTFRNRYFTPTGQLPSGVVTGYALKPGAEARIHTLVEDIALSMSTEGRIDLPPVVRNIVSVPLPEDAMKVYRAMKRDLVANLDILGGGVHTASGAGALSNSLSQVSAGFLYPDAWERQHGEGKTDRIHREKVNAVLEIIAGTGSPVLVAYRYREERDALMKALGSAAHTVDEPDIQARWNRGEIPVLLAHPYSAGHGLNLQEGPGRTIVWSSLTWDSEGFRQLNKRLHRQGQQNTVVIHILVSPGTIDGAILDRLDGKLTVEEALRAHLESPL